MHQTAELLFHLKNNIIKSTTSEKNLGGCFLYLNFKSGQRRYAAFQYSIHICNCRAVIRERHTLLCSTIHSVFKLFLIQHTAAAMNDKLITAEILRKFAAAAPLILKLCTSKLFQPARQLNGADILTLAMMSATLADKNLIPVFQL